MLVNAVGDLDALIPFAQYRQVGIEFTYSTNCVIDSYIPTTGVDVVATNVVNSKKTPTEVVNEYRTERGLPDPTQSRLDQANNLTIVYNVPTLCNPANLIRALEEKLKTILPTWTVRFQALQNVRDYVPGKGKTVFLYLFVSASRFDAGGLRGVLEDWLPGTC